MKTNERKHYIDNLRWLILLVLIPYHTAQAWNTWGEPNYIYFERNRLISSRNKSFNMKQIVNPLRTYFYSYTMSIAIYLLKDIQ